MNVALPKDVYIVAVSGGVDSVVLLHVLTNVLGANKLVVAHFDHGIRSNSAKDATFVQNLASKYGTAFISQRAQLGPQASEQTARTARYNFLHSVLKAHNAKAIITAHHQDDLAETMLLHVRRGTGRHGLDPMRRTPSVMRPLLQHQKSKLVQYAKSNNLVWVEDSTNLDTKYTRNMLRQMLAQNGGYTQQLVALNERIKPINDEIEAILSSLILHITATGGGILRGRFVVLTYKVQKELVLLWLITNGVQDVNISLVEQITMAIKTARIGTKMPIKKNIWLVVGKNVVEILQK